MQRMEGTEVKYFTAEGNQTLSVSKNDSFLTEKLCVSVSHLSERSFSKAIY